MKYIHTNRISLPCYEYVFRTWPSFEWSVKVSTTHTPPSKYRECSTHPRPFLRHTYIEIIQCHGIQLFHACLVNSQNYATRCRGQLNALLPEAARPRAIVH